MLIADEMLLFG